ncbi:MULTISPECIES: GIY-YIG nuclease family protein [unclassified Halomonas]|uniref:GIY-YIG nuclease family protein n=1 Tax=unclassified Halomonas TaxID=2609666 RepID=UPI002885F838|nr:MULTISPECIES: GIY-YIG nuclease family protein [unclassified Halomonas]MDT0502573.1 GIY-YIG nuclease family protein [Halomonas sp. PAR7]MDT0511715.1 GIY-YIG nuclease family protein [Halomonas sp. LES1]MDT0592048.1 GIY-YIG nuclease family protein [Halomonas sp. PAR8]
MTQGRSIRLFLVDGTPNGLLTAEIMNWTGHVLTGPRSKLSELVQRPECGRTGIYFLVGPDPDNSLRPQVYIGESDDVGTRLKQHNRTEERGGKDFWEKVSLVTSKDQNLTKAHVKYLESLLIQSAGQTGRSKLINGTAHEYINLPESDRADMAFFLEQIRTVLPVLGFDFLRDRPMPSSEPVAQESRTEKSPRFIAEVPRHGIKAHGQEIDGEFYVLEGSLARGKWTGVDGGYQSLYQQLCDDGVLVEAEQGLRRFSTDYAFSSPSAAAAVVSGRSANGREHWKVEGRGQTYAAWQDQQVSAAAAEAEPVST